ncbi:MAG: PEP-CTERM sorting domain-containing protein [Cyanobacteria bacterium P01_F01_bin.150]
MLKRSSFLALLALGTALSSVALDSSAAIANPTPPLAIEAFADKAIFYQRGESRNWDSYFGDADASERWDVYDPSSALGRNNWTKEMTQRGALGQWDQNIGVSLGKGGVLTVEFTDNYLTGSGNAQSDLWIYEIGGIAEKTSVEISVDGTSWYDVGVADRKDRKNDSGVGIDIDGLLAANDTLNENSLFSYVRVTDTGGNKYRNFKAGADIDAIAALSFVKKDPPPPVDIPEPSMMLGMGLLGLGILSRRKSANTAG